MEQFYEPPKQHHRIDIHDLFPTTAYNPEMTSFVPFKQERDKLGRLISKENKFSEQSLRFSSSCQLSGKNFVRRQELTEREKSTDNRVEKIFKVNSIPAIHSARDKTLRITTSQSKKNIVPAVGQYDFAAVADKVKYSRAKMAEIKAKPSMPSISLPTKHQMRLPPKLRINKLDPEEYIPHSQVKKLELNQNLPQLQKFHTMQKLQMNISANFERDHERFKSLVRQSLLLSNRIKRELELD